MIKAYLPQLDKEAIISEIITGLCLDEKKVNIIWLQDDLYINIPKTAENLKKLNEIIAAHNPAKIRLLRQKKRIIKKLKEFTQAEQDKYLSAIDLLKAELIVRFVENNLWIKLRSQLYKKDSKVYLNAKKALTWSHNLWEQYYTIKNAILASQNAEELQKIKTTLKDIETIIVDKKLLWFN